MPGTTSGNGSWGRRIVFLLGLGCIAWGQFLIYDEEVSTGTTASVIGALVFFLGWSLPPGWLSSISNRAKTLVEKMVRTAQKLFIQLAKSQTLKPKKSIGRVPSSKGPEPVESISPEGFQFPRQWLLVPAGILAALSQWFLFREKVTPSLIAGIGVIPFLSVYFQAARQPLQLIHPGQNLRTLFLLGLVLPFQVWGGSMLWEYNNVLLGFALTTLASGAMLAILLFYPLELLGEEKGVLTDITWQPTQSFFSVKIWRTKGILITLALICWFLATQTFGTSHQGLSVSLGFFSIFLILASFPWLPFALQNLPLGGPRSRAALAVLVTALSFWLGMQGQKSIESGRIGTGLWFFLSGGICLILALSPFASKVESSSGDSTTQEPEDKKGLFRKLSWIGGLEVLWVMALVAVSFGFRLWNVDVFPYGAEGDEAAGGLYGLDLLSGRYENPLIHANVPLHFFWVTAFFMKTFGLSMLTLRLHSVVWGAFSILWTYLFSRLLWRPATATLVTILMSFSYWHLHYSRFGHYNIEQVCFQMAAFYFFFRSIKKNSVWGFIISGSFFGLAMLPHLASRLLPFEGIALLIYFFLTRREILLRHATGFLAFVIASWMITSPAIMYWTRTLPMSTQRSAEVSIFNKAEPNAPTDTVAGFVNNAKISMLMFNHRGDTRHRDNPVAPDKILEHWSAILFALAFCYSLYHWRQPVIFFLLGCFFMNISASVFSVEAPQTLRSAGNIPIVFVLMGPVFGSLCLALKALGRKTGLILFLIILLPAISFFAYKSGWTYFVDKKHQSFDVLPTMISEEAGKYAKPNSQVIFWATGFGSGHPPVNLFRRGTPIRNFYCLAEYLPLIDPTDKNFLVILCDSYQPILPYLLRLYPGAKVSKRKHRLHGTDLLTVVDISSPVRANAHGLRAEILQNGVRTTIDNAPLEYPLPGSNHAQKVTWSGTLFVPKYGNYRLSAQAEGKYNIRLNGRDISQGDNKTSNSVTVPLAQGLHPIQVRYEPSRGNASFVVMWEGSPIKNSGGFRLRTPFSENIPIFRTMMKENPEGWYGEYFANPKWAGEPLWRWQEPMLLNHWLDSPIPGKWSARWRASLLIKDQGSYRFRARTGGYTEIRINGLVVHRSGLPVIPVFNPPKALPTINLQPGRHDIEVLFSTSGPPSLDLLWGRDKAAESLILPSSLNPWTPSTQTIR